MVVVLGHADHGKTALISFIRNRAKNVPELRFVDTPGHAEYADLRKETGKLADLAVVVVDLKKGVREQTIESMELLQNLNVPFVIAANKVDAVRRYVSREGSFIENLQRQDEKARENLDKKVNKIIEKLAKLGFTAERVDRIHDINKQICIIPTSAVTGEGLTEVLAVLAGMAHGQLEQKFKEAGFTVEKKTSESRENEIAQRISRSQIAKKKYDELYLMISDGVFKVKKRNPNKGNLIEIKHPNFMPSFQRPVVLKILDPFHGTRTAKIVKQGNVVVYTENGQSRRMDAKTARYTIFEWLMGLGDKIIQIDANTREYMGAEHGSFPDAGVIGDRILEVFEEDPSYKIVLRGFAKDKLMRMWVQGNKVLIQDEEGKKSEYEISNQYHRYYFKSKVNNFVKKFEGPTNLVFKAPPVLPEAPAEAKPKIKIPIPKILRKDEKKKAEPEPEKLVKEAVEKPAEKSGKALFSTDKDIKKMESSADFLVEFTRRMANEPDLDRRADRLKKSLSYGRHTYQKILPEDVKRVAHAFASAMKDLPVDRQKELMELIIDEGLRKHILDRLEKPEEPAEVRLETSIKQLEAKIDQIGGAEKSKLIKKLRTIEKKLEGRPVREVKRLEVPERKRETKPSLKDKLQDEAIKEKIVEKEGLGKIVKKNEVESELEMAQRLVKEIVARRIAGELDLDESQVLDHLEEGGWIDAPLAALDKTVKEGVPEDKIKEEVEKIIDWIDNNLYEGLVEEYRESRQNQT